MRKKGILYIILLIISGLAAQSFASEIPLRKNSFQSIKSGHQGFPLYLRQEKKKKQDEYHRQQHAVHICVCQSSLLLSDIFEIDNSQEYRGPGLAAGICGGFYHDWLSQLFPSHYFW